ncbi:endonuclease G, mitochondrial isoform X2 [Paralichthys olivaceus]|uniref:endonuclease G, mitochondrial isoform X2 n=1 Tax=Paralichthys olivaceus TaxID=8255 RepID=UPI00097DB5E9|nr:PREDICTED: endonuclease G, mitochondrial isoform X2 [Paralichthys olivaceus]
MLSWCRTGATLVFGAGVGAAVSRLLSFRGGEEEEDRAGVLHRVPVLPVPRVLASELTVSPGASGAVMKYGFPSLANIKTRESYVTSYDPRTRTASWVIERLNPASLCGSSNRKYCDFREDDSVHLFHRSTNDDYRGSGFDRGHLAAAANHKWSQKAMDDTFYLSNVAPQVIGRNHVAVPTHFFKVLILEQADGRGVEIRSYVLPNEPIDEKVPLERFLVPIETIERASGLLFVPNIMKRTNSLQAVTDRPTTVPRIHQ